jgi:basic membrane lipoprotein Med (substrate-binding protein (PBP1-ABC) superfamily)
VSAGKEQAIAQISRGADVIFQNADAAGLGVFQAVKEAKGVKVVGSNSNQNDIVPEATIGSVVIDLPRAFLEIAREVKKGGFKGRVFNLGLHDRVVTFVPNPAMSSAISPATRAGVDSVEKQMIAGTFKIAASVPVASGK